MAVLTREHLAAVEDLDVMASVEVPEWDATVIVGRMTSERKDLFEYEIAMRSTGGGGVPSLTGLKAFYVALSMRNEDGSVFFTDEECPDVLRKRCSISVDRIYQEAEKLNPDIEKQIQSAEENSDAGHDGSDG